MQELLAVLQAVKPLSAELIQHLARIVKTKVIAKNELLIKNGEHFNDAYLIKSGWMRSYYKDGGGEMVSMRFMHSGDLLLSVNKLVPDLKTAEFIHALEDTELYYISYTELQQIYERYPEFNYLGRILMEKYLGQVIHRILLLKIPKAIDRYNYLLKISPELFKHIPAKYLASYLGIVETSFSRLKKRKVRI